MKKIFLFAVLLILSQSPFAQVLKVSLAKLKPFIPAGYSVLANETGDLNHDNYADVILVLKYNHEADSDQAARPLLILLGKPGGKLSLFARNDSVVLCKACGGVFGDPFDGIEIKGRYFTIDHYGGSRFKWTRMITFKYDPIKKDFILHKDAGVSFDDTLRGGKLTTEFYKKQTFDKLKFKDYKNGYNDE
ncbi:hypothetical protein [Mucilaginibacter flavus]|uniref:hypothetical protein n=1 Tax=Mucilaginibacter flavus TaxID=931504 RepID=UPI0025B4E48F|nr:hypothetical protein [Mucilaginibacter flavus]MDN3584336.1 hypothetical protein [Mucilaginibacter flavus]